MECYSLDETKVTRVGFLLWPKVAQGQLAVGKVENLKYNAECGGLCWDYTKKKWNKFVNNF